MKYSLDKNQLEAVSTDHNNVLIVAAPGSGKTTVIINRTAHLIKSIGVRPENIIIITFTKAAALNMKQRYRSLFNNIGEPFFGTFHGLFYKILRRHCDSINIIQAYESYRVVKKVLEPYMDEVNEDKSREIINDISKYKSLRCSFDEFEPSIEKSIFKQCYDAYETYKFEKNVMDFDDLQLKCLELFKNDKRLLIGYRNLFKYMLVDEFQDCDSLQIEMLKLLNENNSLYAVGDEDQCIYGFRGSRPDCMVNFNSIFKDGKKIYLNINYRSVCNIVDISKNLIKNNVLRNDKNIQANKMEKGNISILNNVNENSQAEEISQSIIKLQAIDNLKFSDFAILYRTNVESRSLIDNFIRKSIPFRLLDKEYNFFEHFICKDILSYLRLSIDCSNKESFLRIINKPFRYIGKSNLERIRKYKYKEDLFEVLKNIEDIPIYQMKTIDKLKRDVQKLNKMSLMGAIQCIVNEIGYRDHIMEYAKKYKFKVQELEDIIEEFKKAAEEYKTIITFLSHVEEVGEQLKNNKKDITKDSVILSTIHGVKGMEFKNVFVINCCEENIPHKNSLPDNVEEERRLFYVGITRAIDNLWICFSRDVRGKTKDPSRFIKECELNFSEDCNGGYKVGDNVKHISFGQGKIISLDSNIIEIEFTNGIKRKFDAVILGNNRLINKVS
ncbi:ATP-dependent helicase [Clostridium sp.]|jgi:DNA helicase-2/ATP-dependent DNA helicase PcrA|uniref:ATP-dependent helicase n=1 Tax=Clostridium sp. TaxID=1506 RepID=UPI00258DD958|nr:ATP-dependent helicase [Clostridium sp.]MDF2502639.1 helicase, superfamily [Clostridium sp.]